MEDGALWLTDPEQNHSCTDCDDIDNSTEQVLARQIYMRNAQGLREDPIPASIAHQRSLTVISNVAASAQQDQLIKMKFPNKRTAKKTYQNNAFYNFVDEESVHTQDTLESDSDASVTTEELADLPEEGDSGYESV
ncbi:hypothetical protein QR680_017414 [Steinernema hermaphroditum]|uniref:Uncharacterized protein n=1 Tax=Steinernema hermaphroditum TaxID=289476 RepID=A0AA39HEG3_9BILA|nr:hypothetical protein QR680_017414 [Steinernema hermaphroditum]